MRKDTYDYIQHFPTLVSIFHTKVIQAAAGYQHSLVLDVKGTLLQLGSIQHKSKTPCNPHPNSVYHLGCTFPPYNPHFSNSNNINPLYKIINLDHQFYLQISVYGTTNMALDSQN